MPTLYYNKEHVMITMLAKAGYPYNPDEPSREVQTRAGSYRITDSLSARIKELEKSSISTPTPDIARHMNGTNGLSEFYILKSADGRTFYFGIGELNNVRTPGKKNESGYLLVLLGIDSHSIKPEYREL